ncbi:hypothetical protein SEPCBS119000_004701 [Sporothrix epigloea]|uniref:Uncharacterized protein n=1 Tax=Sporothrix epigloea TaxID=1892477 RepID=A0ABP0DTI7_9PEZI
MPCTVANVPQVQPWLTVSSEDVFAFLHAQISRVCYLAEHLIKYDSGNRDQGLSAAIYLAVRLLRYSYSSGTMERDPLLFKSDWHPNRPRTMTMSELRAITRPISHEFHRQDVGIEEFPDIEDLLSRGAEDVAENGDGAVIEISDDDDFEYEDAQNHDSIEPVLPDLVLSYVETSDYENDEVDAGRLSSPSDSEYQWNECAQEELSDVDVEHEVALPLPRRTRLPTPKYETEESRARRELIGLGMNYSARKYGFGWWLPDKFDFIRWRPNDEIAAHVASKATLWPGARSFKCRGGVVSVDTGRHAQYLVDQLTEKNVDLLTTPHAVEQWRALLICIVIRQYDLFLWGRVWALSKRTKYWSFRQETMRLYGPDSPPPYCFEVFRELFLVRGLPELPNILNGPSGKARSALQLIECLFDPIEPGSDQSGKKTMTASTSAWMNSPYRALTKHCFDLVKKRSGEAAAKSWLRELHLAVALTHWILPAPTARGIFTICDKAGMRAKENRINWFSSIFSSYTQSGKEVPYESTTIVIR